jgi:hypothetical protein
VLTEEYGYTIQEIIFQNKKSWEICGLYMFQKKKLLLSDKVRRFIILAKEIAYNYLEITERLFTFSWIKFDNFDQVLNNFYASYFGALLIPRKQLVNELNLFWLKQIRSLRK